MQPLIVEFTYIRPIEMLDGLLLLSDIHQHIDLVLGVSLPNIPHYRINPQEHAISQGYVCELLRNGFIPERMSPCAVPALFCRRRMGVGICVWIVGGLTRLW